MTETGSLFENQGPKVYSVVALTEEIKSILEDRFELVWVEGEISNFRVPSSGHYYLTLKDEKAQIRAVMFRPQARVMRFMPEDGMKVLARGRIGVYSPRGEYQLVLDYLEPLGVGALALAFEQLKKRLAEQGLFDPSLKRPLPYLPGKVAVITSPTGAAVRDFLKVIRRRFANIEITILPVKVQGEEAAGEMVEALEVANRELDADVIVLTRGGGSLEDLWAFNQETLALAIRASRIPVVSAVGHEIDITIADLAADLRAPTPSAAAEMLVIDKAAMQSRLSEFGQRLQSFFTAYLHHLRQRLSVSSRRLRDPRREVADLWMRLDEMNGRLFKCTERMMREKRAGLSSEFRALLLYSPLRGISSFRQALAFHRQTLNLLLARTMEEKRSAVSQLQAKLDDLSPLAVLKRGYSLSLKLPEKKVLRKASEARKDDRIQILLSAGALECRVEEVRDDPGPVVMKKTLV